MSGGAFEYKDMRLDDIADVIDHAITNDDCDEVKYILEAASNATRKLRKLLHAVDYYLEYDIGADGLRGAFEEYAK